MEAGASSPRWIEREVEELVEQEYDAQPQHYAQPEEEANAMTMEKIFAEYAKPSLDELFRRAEQTQQRVTVNNLGKPTSPEANRKLANLVADQKAFLHQLKND